MLNSPEEYDGKEVEVIGIFHYRSEDVALYKKRHSGQDQAVWVDLSDARPEGTLEELHNRRITIKGTFSRSDPRAPGRIRRNIERCHDRIRIIAA